MKNIINSLILFTISFSLIFTPTALAGEIYASGTTLEEDSYVFTIEEAEGLMRRIEELESKELELQKYKELEAVRLSQISLYQSNEEYYLLQIDRYRQLDITNNSLLERYQKRNRFQTAENVGFFLLGMGITFGSISAANAIIANQNANF